MIHNGIEYGLMQAYAEGFDILRGKASEALPADQRFDLDLAQIAEVWRRGSVVTSWLLDLTADRPGARTRNSVITAAPSPTVARAAGPSTPPWNRRCRCRC